ncbi:MAG: 2'-5' RNA ligase family protein [Candidatus Nomurabacteria bacterium]|nr:MAG: 2'-5' RNA ligase family protein [Candidatus Nomurabacteria bacterium]
MRNDIARTFDVHEALRIPPHITLFYPFDTEAENIGRLQHDLDKLVKLITALPLSVVGFKPFDNEVWFLDLEQKAELHAIKDAITHLIKSSLNIVDQRRFSDVYFHCTLAFRDVTPEKFEAIGEYLKDRQPPIDYFVLDAVAILEQQQDRTWKVLSVHPLLG